MRKETIQHIGVEKSEGVEEQELWEETIRKMRNLKDFDDEEIPLFEEIQAKEEDHRALIQLLYKFREKGFRTI